MGLGLRSAYVYNKGEFIITLKRTGERFKLTPCPKHYFNLIIGDRYGWPIGDLIVENLNNGDVATVTFSKKDKQKNYFTRGTIKNK